MIQSHSRHEKLLSGRTEAWWLFGSHARGDAQDDSDIDILPGLRVAQAFVLQWRCKRYGIHGWSTKSHGPRRKPVCASPGHGGEDWQ